MKKLFVSALAILGLVACAKDDVVSVQDNRTAIGFDTFVENVTRVGYTDDNPLKEFDVWAFMNQTCILDGVRVYDGPNYRYDNTQYWIPGQRYFFAALAPRETVTVANPTNTGLGEVIFTNVDGTDDLIYATSTVDNASSNQGAVELQFNHLLSKVKFSFQNGFADTNYTFTVSGITMTAPKSASINLTTGEYTLDGTAGDIILTFGDNPTSNASKGSTVSSDDRLTIPAGEGQVYNITFNVNLYVGGNCVHTYPKTASISGITLEVGKAYNFAAVINPDSLQLNEITFAPEVEGWVDSADNDALLMAAALGGEATLTGDVTLEETLAIEANATINLNNNTLNGDVAVAAGVQAVVNNGTIVNEDNTVSGITSNGDLTLDNVTIESARHALRIESGNTVINSGTYKVAPISSSTLFALNVGDGASSIANVTIKGGTFIGPKGTMADSGGALTVKAGSTVTIEGGNFSGGKNNTISCNGTLIIKGGSFDQQPKAEWIAPGYDVLMSDGLYYVLPAVVADAAETAGVTSVTESTSDVKAALADNGEVALFMWNDVAYIAQAGEVVIASAADEATTVRGVVEESLALTSATVSEGVEVVGNRTFRKCKELATVALPNTLTEIGPAVFQSCSKLANVTIPATVQTIGEGAFAECVSLTSINIPNGITRLEKDVLRNTGLVSVEIPASVNYIGTYAFRDCESLTEVRILSPEFTIEGNTFTNMAAPVPTMTIYVVNAEMKAYLDSTLSNYDKSYITVAVM